MPKLSPMPFQRDAILDMEDHDGRVLVAFDMGLGKTLITLQYLRRNAEIAFPAVVVCPASVKLQWEQTAAEQIGIRPTVLTGTTPTPDAFLGERLIVVNYDILSDWLPYLQKAGIKTVVFDESHYLANRSTLRTKAAKQLSRGKRVIALSGTPILNRPAELWPILNLIWPKEFNSFWSFGQRFCEPRKTPWGWQYKGATNLPELHRLLLRMGMMRKLRADVLHEFPEKQRIVLPFELSNAHEYAAARDDFLQWLISSKSGSATAAVRAQKLTQIGHLKRLAAKLKLRAVIDWITTFLNETDEKLVLFAVHKKCIEALQRRITTTKSVIIDGGTVISDRKQAVKQFQADRNTRIFIGNIQAAGTGIDGLQVSQHCAFVELSWRPVDHTQAEARLHRIGQESHVSAYYLIAKDTIEEKLCHIIQTKQAVVSRTLDGRELDDDIDIYDQLIASMSG